MLYCDFGVRPVANEYEGRWVVVTGIRDIDPDDEGTVVKKLHYVALSRPAGIIFGGARGVDTIALKAAGEAKHTVGEIVPRLVAIVPGFVDDQPCEARDIIRRYADEIIEMGLNVKKKMVFFERNRRMITEARLRDTMEQPICLAFPSDLPHGGTRSCMADAMRAMVKIEEIEVKRMTGGND